MTQSIPYRVYSPESAPVRIGLAPWPGAVEPCVIRRADEYRRSGRSPLIASADCPWVGIDAYLLNLLIETANVTAEFVFYGENGTEFEWGRRMDGGEWVGMLGDVLNGTIDMVGATYALTTVNDLRFYFTYPVGKHC